MRSTLALLLASAIDLPSGPKPVVERFTGRSATPHRLGARAHRGKVRQLMAEVLIPHRPAARSIPWDHVYAVLDFDPAVDVVVLWNPWGPTSTRREPRGRRTVMSGCTGSSGSHSTSS
jgi:hypothetical protein